MTIRSDITIDASVSPRIATVDAPSVEVTIQDLHDTLRDAEAAAVFIDEPPFINTAGLEDLGGGVAVGLTSTLQNTQVQFEGRTTPAENGSCTSDDSTGKVLNATGGQFQINNVERGFTVFNSTTGAMATVLSVASDIQLTSQVLSGGSRATWLNTDGYVLYDNVQCNISGGNLVAIDDVGASISSVLQSPNTNVVRTSSSSATLQSIEELQASSFAGKEGLVVVVDAENVTGDAVDSSIFPSGTREQPCLTEANFDAIHESRGIRNASLVSSITLSATHTDGHIFFGDNPQTVVVTLDSGGSFAGCKFQDCYILGQFTSSNIVWECIVGSITEANGFIYKSTLIGPIVVSSDPLNISKCWIAPTAVVAGVTVDMNNDATASVIFTQWEGGTVHVINMVAGAVFGIGGTAGSFTLDASCTGGTVNWGGAIRKKSDTSTGVSYNDANTASQVWNELLAGHTTAGSSGQAIIDLLAAGGSLTAEQIALLEKAAKALKTGEFIALK